MRTFRRIQLWCVLCLAVATAGQTAESDENRLIDNLYLDGSVGAETSAGEDTTGLGTAGFNWGIPLGNGERGPSLGLQVGADVKVSEKHPGWNATLGGFSRDLPSVFSQRSALAVLVDYEHTFIGNDLWAFRPVIGSTAGEKDALGFTGSVGLNDDSEIHDSTRLGPAGPVREEMIDRIEGFWNRDWTRHLSTELSVGYQLGDIDELFFAPQVAYGVTQHIDVGVGAQINADGNYTAAFTSSYHFGGTGKHETIHNIRGSGKSLYTPFPKRNLANFLHETDRPGSSVGQGGAGIIAGGEPGSDVTGITPGAGPASVPAPGPAAAPGPGSDPINPP
ncbi:MAG TPA: hypothetical protein VJB15_09170, partial [Rhodothermia bacterium]|nr:hypothetical protein [Rhodothermia bacterium]